MKLYEGRHIHADIPRPGFKVRQSRRAALVLSSFSAVLSARVWPVALAIPISTVGVRRGAARRLTPAGKDMRWWAGWGRLVAKLESLKKATWPQSAAWSIPIAPATIAKRGSSNFVRPAQRLLTT